MNKLSIEKQEMVIKGLVEGASIRSIERMTGVHRDTIMRLMVRAGQGCERLMKKSMYHLKCKDIQVDEIWCFVGKKQRHLTPDDNIEELGDQWVFVALDSESKLIPSYTIGKRTYQNTCAFLNDLAERLDNRVQLSSDSFNAYISAVEQTFGMNVDYGQIVKSYEAEPIGAGRYSPPHVVSANRNPIMGNPDGRKISTSHVERQNLTMRMQMRRFTRLTNAFSKKLENLKAAIALHFAHYNFCRVHQSLRVTPAMAAKITDHIWGIEELLAKMD